MSILQYILMGIGVISIMGGLYWLGKKIFEGMAKGLEAGFRNQFPFDYLISLSWIVQLFKRHGFQEDEYIDAGTDCPGIKMVRGDELVEIYLIAPLDGKFRIKIIFKNHDFSIEIPSYESEKYSVLLSELISVNLGKYSEEKGCQVD